MGSTNKTQYLELPQWIGTDQPTWLGDMNDAFLKIDEGYDTISGNASTAIAQAGQAVQDAENALTKATSVETVANQANTNANTALQTANNALETANTANSGVSNINSTLDSFAWQSGTVTSVDGVFNSLDSIVNRSAGLKLLGIAMSGVFTGAPIQATPNMSLFTLPSWARPATKRTIYGGAVLFNGLGESYTIDITIDTDGTVKKGSGTLNDIRYMRMNIMLVTATW